jgi:hypothetical protein
MDLANSKMTEFDNFGKGPGASFGVSSRIFECRLVLAMFNAVKCIGEGLTVGR